MDAYAAAVVALAFLLGGLAKGVVGMGLPTVALAVLGTALGLHEALPLLVVPAFVTNVWQALFGGHLYATMRRFWPLILGTVVGVTPGTWILFAASPRTMNAALGAVLCLYALVALAAIRPHVPARSEPLLGPAVGVATGLAVGATGTLVIPVVLYFEALRLERDAFIQAMGLSFAVSSLALALALAGQRALDLDALLLSTLALIPAAAGMYAGQLARRRLSPAAFRRWLLVSLLVLGGHLILKTIV